MGDQVDTDDIEESTPRARKMRSKPKPKFNQRKIVPLPANVMGIIDREVLTRLPEREDDNHYVGDIIFVQMSGYPYWPCMITVDPQTNRYTKRSADKSGIFYHVQYFGLKAYRSYASPNQIMNFEGRAKYESDLEHLKEVPGTPKAVRKSQLAKLVIKQAYKKDWGIACEEAEAAQKMDRAQRIKDLTFEYVMANELPQASKRKEGSFLRSQTPKAKKSRKSNDNPLSVFEFDDSADELVESKNNIIPPLKLWRQKRANRKGDFSVFWARMRPEMSNDKPDASEEDIKSMLERKWSLLPEDQRSRYFLREEEDDEPVPAKTPRRASTKKASAVNSGAACTPRPRKPKANTPAKIKTEQSNGEIVKEEVDNSNHIMDEDDNDLSDEERNLIIAEAPQRTRKKRKAEASTSNNVTEGGNVAPVDQAATDVPSTPVSISKKPVKTPRSTRNVRTPKPPKLSVGGDSVEIPVISDAASEEKLEIDVKPKSAKKSQVQSTPSTTRKRTLSKSATPVVEKTPLKRGRKSTAIKEELTTPGKSAKRVTKKHNNSVCIPPLPALDPEETRNSEDASSLSENGDVKEPIKRACPQCWNTIENERLVVCQGTCLEAYHEKCVPSDFDRKSNLCSECSTGKHLCFICREHTDEVQKCTESDCGKYYHIKCLQKNYPHRMVKDEASEGFICPLHFCLTCYVEHEDNQLHSYKKSSRRLLKCLRCPIAYHFTDECIAAGTSMVCPPLIICPEHYQPKGSSKHVNVNWCFSCNSGGSLICCERCPAAFHRECLEIEPTEGSFFCGDCLVRRQLHYEDIVWVKLGSWRWWPGRICSPKFVPDNIMNYDHSVGQFPVYFYGSKDYFWISQGRAFLFVEGDSAKLTNLKGAKKMYMKAIEEAVAGFEAWKISKKEKNSKLKPPPYHHIKVNRRVGTNKPMKSVGKDENPKDAMCICDPESENPCGEDSDCYNRVLSIECDSSRCKADDKKCKNRRFLKRLDVKTIPFKTEGRGWGLKSAVDVKKGQFVIEYVGELINEAECEARIANMIANNETNFYFLTIDKDNIIDAGPKGNLARFMNHSCSPNCETQKWIVNGATRVGLFAKYDIPAGTELTFNYNLNCRGNEKTKCECGAENCSGFLGVRPKNLEEKMKKPAKLEVKRKKVEPKTISKKTFESLHEDFCFKCGEGGQLVMCDKKGCSKSYHLQCLDLEKLPRGTWYCPWHHCDECGKPSARYCSICPTSFCSEHGEDILSTDLEGDLTCRDHGDPMGGDKEDEKAPSDLLTTDGPLQVSDSPTDEPPKVIDEKINAESNCEETKVKGQILDEVDINELKKQTVIDFTEDKPQSPEELKESIPQPEQEAEKVEKESENSPDVSESTKLEEPLTIAEPTSETPMDAEQTADPEEPQKPIEIPSTTESISSEMAAEKEDSESKLEPKVDEVEKTIQPQEETTKDSEMPEVEKSSEIENQLETHPSASTAEGSIHKEEDQEAKEAKEQHESDTPEVHGSTSDTQMSTEPEQVKGPTNGIEAVEMNDETAVPEHLKQVTDQKDNLTKEEPMVFENSQVSPTPHISEKNSEAILTSSTDPEKSIETHVEKSNFTLSPSAPVTDGQKCTN